MASMRLIALVSMLAACAVASDSPLGFTPNIVFILTDDQDTRLGHDQTAYSPLGSLEVMPNLQELLMEQGVLMSNFFVNTPICCPSRTESFSGRYYHNIGPPNEQGSCMHVNTTNIVDPDVSMFGLIGKAGLKTGVFGKTTNDQSKVLPLAVKYNSMDFINSPLDYNDYMGLTYFRKFENGTSYTEKIDEKNPVFGTPYQTTQIGNRSLEWLDTIDSDTPFFAYLGPHAPHYPAQPAPWYEEAFPTASIPITPNYNVSSPDKTQHIRQNPPFTDDVKCWEDQHFKDRWRTLLSVDDLIRDLVAKLSDMGVLDKTFIIYTSDHGYKQGQWRVGTSKQHPYETDIHVPFVIRGPGIPKNQTMPYMTGNVDILPTIMELIGGKSAVPGFLDGKSMVPLLVTEAEGVSQEEQKKSAADWRKHFLIEYLSVGTYYNDHSAIYGQPAGSCGKAPPRGPNNPKNCVESSGVGDGECYFVDSEHSNSWRELRINNGTADLSYIEYDFSWKWDTTNPSGAGLQYYELYDIAADPYQMNNIYNSTTYEQKVELHSTLVRYYKCAEDSCP